MIVATGRILFYSFIRTLERWMARNRSIFLKISGPLGLKARTNLLRRCLAVWPRRSKKLLEINCGKGFFLPFLWEHGFDVTATERDQDLRSRAVEHAGFRAEVVLACSDHLPFDDDAFDWTILHIADDDAATFENSLNEALRVTTGGMVVTFWNSASLSYLAHKLGGGKFWPWPRFNCLGVWRELKKAGAGRLTMMSVLSGPPCTWNSRRSSFFGDMITRALPLGAWCVIRMDIAPSRAVTPLPIRLANARFASSQPVMEWRCGKSLNTKIKQKRNKLTP